jgi:Ferritin-like domain
VAHRPTRRELLAGTLAATAGASAASATGLAIAAGPAAADAGVPSDSQVLSKALTVERLMVLAYRRVLASGVLAAGEDRELAILLGHELEHVATLASRLQAMGAPAPAGPLDISSGDAELGKHHVPGSLTDLHTRHDCLRLLVNLESVAEGVYFTALKTFERPELIRLSAETMACEAQHWTVVSGLRNPGVYVKSVPWPFVTGSS